tara:strand:- start:47804 stop:48451 length:648 start_codon:yes stop_codon:yes gene_type:complete
MIIKVKNQMKQKINSLDNKYLKDIDLDKDIFSVPYRKDIIHSMIRYQMAKKQSGNHKTKGISEISGTTKKPFKQKGTGSARQGSKRSPQMRGGAVIFGPQVRSHSHKLPKKVRSLALKIALSKKLADGKLKLVDDLSLSKCKTSLLASKISKLGIKSALFISSKDLDDNFRKASRNIPNLDVLPIDGLNVYTIVKRDFLVLTEEVIKQIHKRFEK